MGESLQARAENTRDEPLVSIIMNCRNGESYLREAIDSIFAQTYGSWEIIFFDNASTDGSEAIARSYGGKLHYFRSAQSLPLGAARNAALHNIHGELIAFLDTDDRWLPDKLAWQVEVFCKYPQVDFAYSNYYILNASTGRTTLGLRRPQPEGEVFAAFLRHYPVNLQTVMLRSSSLRKLNDLFDPALEVSEEYDLFMRLLSVSKAHYLSQPTAVYRVHDNMSSIRHIDKYPVENNYILGKLRSMIPGLETRYLDEVAYLKAKIGYWHAAAYMHKGDPVQARKALKPFVWVGAVFFALYLATYLPSGIWKSLLRLKGIFR
ncbi:MAG: glycosyltransferase [Gallionella sp.]|nr:glycosyltransferase [Gallionella sp.]